jgi:hypothetical protein
MWAAVPPFVSQPVVDLIPDQPSRVAQYGWSGNAFGGLFTVAFYPRQGIPVTLESALPFIHAVHLLVAGDSYLDVSLRLGSRYSLKLTFYENTNAAHPFVRYGQRILRAAIYDNATVVTEADLPLLATTLNVCFGYAFAQSGTLQAYAHISRIDCSCGSGTVGLLADVNHDEALAGRMSLVCREPIEDFGGDQTPYGNFSLQCAAMRMGPFQQTMPHLQETWATKQGRAGDRVASLRSSATNFSSAAIFESPLQLNPRFFRSVAWADVGGHSEFNTSGLAPGTAPLRRFAMSLMGQPSSDIAFIPASSSWRSNCGFTAAQVRRMAAVDVSVTDVSLLDTPVSLEASGLVANEYGNNECVGTVAQAGAAFGGDWDTIHVQVRVSGFEDVVDTPATPLSDVVVNTRFVVTVDLFASLGGSRVFRFGQIGFPYAASATVTLTEAEASAFFDGSPLSLADGAIVVTAVGT